MSLLRMESCDLSGVTGEKWSGFSVGPFGAIAFNQTVDGKTCWLFSNGFDGVWGGAVMPVPATDVFYIGARVNFEGTENSNAYFVQMEEGSTVHLVVRTESSSQIEVTGPFGALQTSPGTFANGEWFYLEVGVRIHDSLGWVVIKVDGVEVGRSENIDTRNGATGVINQLRFGSMGSVVTGMRDLVFMDDTDVGDIFNDFIGPAVVQARVASGAGANTEWTPNTGANYAAVDDSPTNDGDTTYVASIAAGDRDTYAFADFTIPAPIAVQAYATARYELAPLNIATVLRRAGTDDDGDPAPPSASYGSRAGHIWTEDPVAAGAWTLANLNATEFGILSVTP